MSHNFHIPKYVLATTQALEQAGFQAYLIGGCVRDLLRGVEPKDWDVTTNAKPEEIQELFEETYYENDFGTVGVVFEEGEQKHVVEVTTYRSEESYTNKRHPDKVTFSDSLEEDLQRRDFTMNAIAYDVSQGQLVDPYDGHKDIKDKIIRTVGNPTKRFSEDALRMMRAVRFSAQLGFDVDPGTRQAIQDFAKHIGDISGERIRDELIKLVESDQPMQGLLLMNVVDLLEYVLPELRRGIGVEQNNDHIYDVWTHLLKALQNAADHGWPLQVRLAALFHDISKPETKRFDTQKRDFTFYGHEVVGARVTKTIMRRLKMSSAMTDRVVKLVRWHMFFSDIDQITLSAVRRLIANVGPDNVWDLMKVRKCDRIGMGRPKEEPYRLRKYESMVEEAMRDPVSVKQLKLNGDIMIAELGLKPGPRMGWMLHALLDEVLEDPTKNDLEHQKKRALELDNLSDEELRQMGQAGRHAQAEEEEKELKKIRDKYYVK